MKWLILFGWALAPLMAQTTFDATLERPLWLGKSGELRFAEKAIEFAPDGKSEPMRWDYIDIQRLDLVSRTELRLLTYDDVRWKAGRDRELRFLLSNGEISDELFERLQTRLERPAVNRVVAPEGDGYRIVAKHLHVVGGCQGELLFTRDSIVYDADDDRHDRRWLFAGALEGAWSSDPYELEIEVREPRAGRPGEIRTWRYQLKQRLDQDVYSRLKRRFYELR